MWWHKLLILILSASVVAARCNNPHCKACRGPCRDSISKDYSSPQYDSYIDPSSPRPYHERLGPPDHDGPPIEDNYPGPYAGPYPDSYPPPFSDDLPPMLKNRPDRPFPEGYTPRPSQNGPSDDSRQGQTSQKPPVENPDLKGSCEEVDSGSKPPPDMPCWRSSRLKHRRCLGPANVTASGKETSFRRAWYQDCRALVDRWAKRTSSGIFFIERIPGDSANKFYSTIYHGSCFLGVSPSRKHALVGDLDIERILKAAVTKGARGMLIAVEGQIECQMGHDNTETTELEWRLYGGPYYTDWKPDD